MGKRIYIFVNILIILTGIYTLFFSGIDRGPMGAVSLLFLLIPPLAERLFRLKLGYPMKTSILIFCLISFSLGVTLRWFNRFPGYDNFAHGLSGILFTLIGLCFYVRIGGVPDRHHQKLLQISFAIFFSFTIAVIWEVGEFAGFLLTGHDAQHHLDTGVFDTMEDIIACAAGSLAAALDYAIYTRKKKSLFMPIVLASDRENQ